MSWQVLGGLGLLLVVVGGLFGAVHHSLRDLSRKRIEDLVSSRNGSGPDALVRSGLDEVLSDPVGHALAAALPRLACESGAAVLGVFAVAALRAGGLAGVGGAVDAGAGPAGLYVTVVDAAVGSGLMLGLGWVLTLALPLAISEHVGERLVLATVPLLRVLHTLAWPVRQVLGLFDEMVRRLAGEAEMSEAEELREDLLDVVTEGELGGQLDDAERGLIEAAVRFREIDAERIMTPRTEIMAIEYTDDLEAVKARVVEIGHSRIPVYRESLDGVAGVLYAKDLLGYLAREDAGAGFELSELLREAVFVPESKSVRDLLSELIAKGVHLAMVADEYGGTSGLVTMEDIIEEAFGEIRDEYDEDELEAPPLIEIDASGERADAEAKVTIHEANAALRSLGLELPESEEYDTVGGLVVTELGRIPEAGERVELDGGVLISVLESESTRVLRARIEAKPAEGGAPGETPNGDAA
ncbi:MAG: hemolysin family protein [Planctomycetota bacterium]